jgi:hypothetical protein
VRRAEDDFHTSGFERVPEVVNVFGSAVDDQMGFAQDEALRGVNQLTGDLAHSLRAGGRRRNADLDGA